MKDQKKVTKRRHSSGVDDTPKTKEHAHQAGLPGEISKKWSVYRAIPRFPSRVSTLQFRMRA